MRYILDPQDVYGLTSCETFRVLKEKEIKAYGEYRTRRLVLEAWDRLEGTGGSAWLMRQPEGLRRRAAEEGEQKRQREDDGRQMRMFG